MLPAVALVSAGALAYEVLLTRLMAIVHWHHFAGIVIGMALLGYGASGSALAVLGERIRRHLDAAFAASAMLFGVTALAGALLAQRVPFNALEVIWDPRQLLHLLTLYLLFIVPFFFAASCVGLAYAGLPAHAGRVYAFDLAGAGAGALLVVLALDHVRPLTLLGLVSAAGPAAALVARGRHALLRRAGLAHLGLALALGLALLPVLVPLELRMSPYKGLSRALQLPGTAVEAERSSSLGLIDVVRSEAVPFREVPGLSLAAPQEPAEQRGIFVDGEGPLPLTRFTGDPAPLAYLAYTTAALPYHLMREPEVLILGAGGGSDALTALVGGAASVDLVELDPELVGLVREDYARFTGGLFERPEVQVHVAEARRFLDATRGRWDVIQLPLLDALGGAGRTGLHETYTYTLEAFRACLERLKPDGVLSVVRWLSLPPRDTLKLVLTAIVALEGEGVAEPGRHLLLVRSWDTAVLLVKRSPFTAAEIAAARDFARSRGFDLDWYPGMAAAPTAAFNTLEGASLHDDVAALLGPGRDAFVRDYKFDLRPATDDRPYFFDFFRWRALPELLAVGRQGNAALVDWGHLVQMGGLALAVLLSLALVLLPLRLGLPRIGRGGRAGTALFFLLLGAAFITVEIAAIQRLILFLGHPVHAVATALAAFLVFAGLGGRLAARLDERPAPTLGRRAPALAAGLACLLAALWAFLLPALLAALDPLEGVARAAAAVGALAPLAFAMGMPFPLALARVKTAAPPLVPWAWGINGCASVVAALLATLLAIHLGLTVLTLMAAAAYLLAAAVAVRAGNGAVRDGVTASP